MGGWKFSNRLPGPAYGNSRSPNAGGREFSFWFPGWAAKIIPISRFYPRDHPRIIPCFTEGIYSLVATQRFFFGIFIPKIGEDGTPFDEHAFQLGWFNHHLALDL